MRERMLRAKGGGGHRKTPVREGRGHHPLHQEEKSLSSHAPLRTWHFDQILWISRPLWGREEHVSPAEGGWGSGEEVLDRKNANEHGWRAPRFKKPREELASC